MILDIDVGNTRLKWLLSGLDGAELARGVFTHHPWPEQPFAFDGEVRRVRICSVQGDCNDNLAALCLSRWQVIPEFAKVESGVAGLHCGYLEPRRLGIDRWLAVLACWQNIARQALVVDAGSALTIDVLNREQHLGGFILPGLQMMQQALGSATWGVRVLGSPVGADAPGQDTSAAVVNGCLSALAGAVEHAAARAGVSRVVLAGGDAGVLIPILDRRLEIISAPDLVLRGLAISLP